MVSFYYIHYSNHIANISVQSEAKEKEVEEYYSNKQDQVTYYYSKKRKIKRIIYKYLPKKVYSQLKK
jgi:hypothetical protein